MNEFSELADSTTDMPLLARIRHSYAAALERTSRGEPPPRIDDFLGEAPPEQRDALRTCLVKMASERLAGSPAPASPPLVDAPVPATQAEPTNPLPQLTMDHVPANTVPELGRPRGTETTEFHLRPGTAEEARSKDLPVVRGYRILGVLGHGAMGVVYKARQEGLDRLVALKMILAGPHASPHVLARFRTEAQAVAHLQHPNIVQIHEVGEQDGLPYFSLEYVDGGSLAEKLAHRPHPARQAAVMLEILARAMHHAHGHHVVHRDLKPANVLLSSEGVPKISDFGLAKRLEDDSSQTRSGTIMGSPSYMAPEQARGQSKDVGPLADVYALGAILYEMLVGTPPFRGLTQMDTINQVLRDEPVPPTRLQPKVPIDLETICLKCLQKEPEKRYADALTLAEDLQHFLRGEPILARPVSAAQRFLRWCRRNPRIAGLSGGIAALLVLVAATSTAGAFRIAKEKQAALTAKELAEHHAEVAIDQANLAVETFGALVSRAQTQLRDTPGARQIRHELLGIALDGLQRLEKSAVTTVGKAERTQLAGQMQLADILMQMGKTQEAVHYYQQGHELAKTLYGAQPSSDKARSNLALTLTKLGDIHLQVGRDPIKAHEHYEQALQHQRCLAAMDAPGDDLDPIGIKLQLIDTLSKLGTVASRRSDLPAAGGHFNEALGLCEKLWASNAEHPLFRQLIIDLCRLLGNIAFRQGDSTATKDYLDRAMKMSEELARDKVNRSSLACRRILMNTAAARGDAYLKLGDAATAAPLYQKALDIAKLLVEIDDSAEYQADLALANYRMAAASLRLGQHRAADEYFRGSLAIRQHLAQTDPRQAIPLMLVLARCGQHEKAVRLAEGLRTANPKSPPLFYIACGYALCVPAVVHGKASEQIGPADRKAQEAYANKAIEAVGQLTAGGYRDLIDLETDPDLDPIRERPAFQKLLKDVRSKLAAN